jgi:hypothetical protein
MKTAMFLISSRTGNLRRMRRNEAILQWSPVASHDRAPDPDCGRKEDGEVRQRERVCHVGASVAISAARAAVVQTPSVAAAILALVKY